MNTLISKENTNKISTTKKFNKSSSICRWNAVEWKSVQTTVFKWQRKIYSASKNNDLIQVRKLQHLLLNSTVAKLLAIRRVTQDNQGKKTAGIDGIKSLTPTQRMEMVLTLTFPTKALPLRRGNALALPGSPEKRPLGIPTLKDRCLQALFKLAMEPEWEARFEANSYGFRPGRNAHDAMAAIKNGIQKKSKYVLDADIAKCFDKIDHHALLEKIGMQGKYRKQIKFWLEAGVLDSGIFSETTEGTPQGGVISPLLANIALHGIETHLKDCMKTIPVFYNSGTKVRPSRAHETLQIIRYADDFVVLHDDPNVILTMKQEIQEFLSKIGLKLSEAKIRLTHTLVLSEEDKKLGFHGEIGFNFLGFTVKQFYSKHRSACVAGKKIGYKTLIYPSEKSMNKHQEKLHAVIFKEGKRLDQTRLILKLNPIIQGWANYFGVSHANTIGCLSKQDYLLYLKLRKWAQRKKGTTGMSTSYWKGSKTKKWSFGTLGNSQLLEHTNYSKSLGTKDGYIKVKGEGSPFDENQLYWTKRLTTNPLFSTRICTLLKSQKGKCNRCHLPFMDSDVMEVNHMISLHQSEKDQYENLQLFHRHCHDTKTHEDQMKLKVSPISRDKAK
jgi:RNA-directed DNA polymerase